MSKRRGTLWALHAPERDNPPSGRQSLPRHGRSRPDTSSSRRDAAGRATPVPAASSRLGKSAAARQRPRGETEGGGTVSRRRYGPGTMDLILHGDNLPLLRDIEDEAVQMVYTDPPFNTGRT